MLSIRPAFEIVLNKEKALSRCRTGGHAMALHYFRTLYVGSRQGVTSTPINKKPRSFCARAFSLQTRGLKYQPRFDQRNGKYY